MPFNSLSYLLFLPAVYLVHAFTPERRRWLVLLAASYAFYAMLKAPYLAAALLVVTAISYGCALRMAGHSAEGVRKKWLWLGVCGCLLPLVLLKYLPALGLHSMGAVKLVTIGVSYFSFQGISYLSDVYLELDEPERHLGLFALYMALFPKLLQGPIERAGELLPQLKQPFRFDYQAARSGLLLFAWGLFKKGALADFLALYADQVFNNVHDYTGISLIVGIYAFALQIYFDFSGYTDMARGTAQIFGIELTQNFNHPYLATSIADFWRRWHISFSRWILDYIFKPLQMWWRDAGKAGTAAALVVTFLVSGVWHGATMGFLAWGGLHGSYLAASTYYRPFQKRLHTRLGIEKSAWLQWWQRLVTFNMVCAAWIFFRANSVSDAWYVLRNCLSGVTRIPSALILSQGKTQLCALVAAVTIYAALSRQLRQNSVFSRPLWVRWTVYLSLVYSIAGSFIVSSATSSFIYFKF